MYFGWTEVCGAEPAEGPHGDPRRGVCLLGLRRGGHRRDRGDGFHGCEGEEDVDVDVRRALVSSSQSTSATAQTDEIRPEEDLIVW